MLKTTLPLSFIVATRFFGLFIVLPVISLYAMELNGANESLVGLLIGIYAFMQMSLQTPFGILSDKIGRKNSLAIGLLIFIIGSFVCACANDIYVMIFGRFLQGCGAVGAVAVALISDFTKEEERTKQMAIMGALIGTAFVFAMILSPLLSAKFGLSSLFHLSGILTFLCLILLYVVVPKEPKIRTFENKMPFLELFKSKDLNLLYLTNFLQKMLMMSVFFIIPIILTKDFLVEKSDLTNIYIFAMIFGFLAMGFSGSVGEKMGFLKQILLVGIFCFITTFIFFIFSKFTNSKILFIIAICLFFIGFNIHEPILQSLASKFAKSSQKGTILGIFNSAGFLGSFFGGVFGGVFFKFGILNLSILAVTICFFWFILLLRLTNPNVFANLYFNQNIDFSKLNNVKGIVEIYETNDIKIIKFNKKIISENDIKQILGV